MIKNVLYTRKTERVRPSFQKVSDLSTGDIIYYTNYYINIKHIFHDGQYYIYNRKD